MTSSSATDASNDAPRIALAVASRVDERVAVRAQYALEEIARAVGLRIVSDADAEVTVGYGVPGDLAIDPQMVVRPTGQPAPKPTMVEVTNGEVVPVFYPGFGDTFDHLAEVFEWCSGMHELSVRERDSVGRIPSNRTLPVHAGLEPTRAWGSRIVDDFAGRLIAMRPELGSRLRQPGRPTVAVSHDLDWIYRSRQDVHRRFGRATLAAARRRDLAGVGRIAATVVRKPLALGDVLDTVKTVLDLDADRGVDPTWVIIPKRAHRRDANYESSDLAEVLGRLSAVDVAVHGSYTSLEHPGDLAAEYEILAQKGREATGGRQHWLRFAGTDLFHELEQAGAAWDSSIGYSDRIGYRHGFATPYRLWDPVAERAFRPLQVPLVLMDVGIDALRRGGAQWRAQVDQVLGECERVRGTAVSVLWHDTVFSGLQVSTEVVDLYHEITTRKYRWESLSSIGGSVR